MENRVTFERPTPALVIEVTAATYRVMDIEVSGPCRAVAVRLPRFVAAFVMRRLGYTLGQIGMSLNGRDHSTITHAVNKIRQRLDAGDERLREQVRQIQLKAERLHLERKEVRELTPEEVEAAERIRQRKEMERAIKIAETREWGGGEGIDEKGCYGVSYRELVSANGRLLRQLQIYHPDMYGV